MLRTRSLLIFVVLAAVSLAALATAPDAADRPANPSDRPAAGIRAGARAKSFAPEKLIRAFRGTPEALDKPRRPPRHQDKLCFPRGARFGGVPVRRADECRLSGRCDCPGRRAA